MGEIDPVDHHVALIGLEETDEVLDEDRLSGAGAANQHQRFTAPDFEVDAPEDLFLTEGLVEADDADHRIGGVAGRGSC